jgi:superfamily II DNA or RNA helicase
MTKLPLRDHQVDALTQIQDAIKASKDDAAGRIVIPTGGGKTFLEAAVIEHQMDQNRLNRIHLVLAPRILLANQLIREFRSYNGPIYRVVAFHSGQHEPDYDDITWQERSTTDPRVVIDEWQKSLRKDQDLVVFSTYHSCGKLKGIDFDTILADESQYCVSSDFNESVRHLSGRVRLFFTATEKHTSSVTGRGLNNASFYGERLYEISPRQLIEKGLIVPPILHVMHADTKDEELSIMQQVIEISRAQDDYARPKLGFSKILFAMGGTGDVNLIAEGNLKIRAALPTHDVFTITSKSGAMMNGKQMRREDFLDRIKDAKDCLIFHYDILSEGIDVDGITGVAMMRNMGVAKLQQTIGRAVRLYKPNPDLKKCALISVPVLNGNEDDSEYLKGFVNAIRLAGFDISYEMVHQTNAPRHAPDSDQVDDAYDHDMTQNRNAFLSNVFHDIESDWFWDSVKNGETRLEDDLDKLLG